MIGLGFIILLGFLPLYNQSPDGSLFYKTQNIEYIFLGNSNNIEIKEISSFGEQKIVPTENNQKLFFLESNERTIIFNEKINLPKEENKFVILFPDNTIYIAYPGSETKIQQTNQSYRITKIYGKIEYYRPNNKQTEIQTNNSEEQKNKSDFSLSNIINNYENKQIKYIINQAGGNIIMQPIYQRFSKKILEIANYIRPNIYINNIENYKKYQQILGRKEVEINYEEEEKWQSLLLHQIEKGLQETRILQ